MNRSIGEIWERVLDGDQDAWGELVRRYARLVETVAVRMGLAASDAEDCAQYSWIALYRHRRLIRDPSRLPAWLIMTTKRRALRMLSRDNRRADHSMELDADRSVPPPDDELLRLELLDALQHAMERLDGRCRTLIGALFLAPENMSYADLARTLGISTNAVGRMRSRCLERLRRILIEMGYLEH